MQQQSWIGALFAASQLLPFRNRRDKNLQKIGCAHMLSTIFLHQQRFTATAAAELLISTLQQSTATATQS